MIDPEGIKGYHAHIYYDEAVRERAARIREFIEGHFKVVMGRWRDMPVGPHPQAMYQVAFGTEEFPRIVPWLMLNRAGLTVLVHPETGAHTPTMRLIRYGSARSCNSMSKCLRTCQSPEADHSAESPVLSIAAKRFARSGAADSCLKNT